MPLLTVQSYFGLGFEATPGTPVVPSYYLPIEAPQWVPNVHWLEDKGMRGSPVDVYSNQAGVRHDEFDCKGNAFLDTFPMLLRAILGSADTVVTAPGSTTLAAAAIAGASTVSTVATIAAGAAIIIGAGTAAETHITQSVSGAGPFTVTLVAPLANAQVMGAAVTGLTAHAIGLANNVATGSQPPSATLVDFDAGAAGTTTARQLSAAKLAELSINFATDGALSYTAKWWTYAAGTVAAPTETYSPTIFVPAWACGVTLGGVSSSVVAGGTLDLKRMTSAIHTNGNQSPYSVWDAALSISGKTMFVLEQGSTVMATGTLRAPQSLDLVFTEPTSHHLCDIHMGQIQLKDPKIVRGKSYLEVEANFSPEGNTTDAVAGGYSPIKATTANAVIGAY